MNTDNELIAEFMKLPFEDSKDDSYKLYHHTDWEGGEWAYGKDDLCYHKSWDWLMPCVEKIEGLYREAFPSGEEFIKRVLAHDWPIDEHYTDVIAIPLGTHIGEVYEAIIKFIKWYNQQPKP